MSENPQSSALLRLLNEYSYKRITELPEPDLGLAQSRPYPFLAIVGQMEMRLALLLSVINPAIGGVLLIGTRGTGKTTAVRSLASILPYTEVSTCEEGILPHDIKALDEEQAQFLYPNCYEKYKNGEPISQMESVRIVELPLNARIEDVVGGVNERSVAHRNVIRVERGILSRADNQLLYIDEVNLLDDQIVDVILDASAQGSYSVRRGAVVGTYRSRFVLIGSMNPEEGRLRPQILDRFGLRITVTGIEDHEERMEVYQRARAYRMNPTRFIKEWELASMQMQEDIVIAKSILRDVTLSNEMIRKGIQLVRSLGIDSHRAEYTLFEAARAHTAADIRTEVTTDDLRAVAPMTLRQRKSEFMANFVEVQQAEDQTINNKLDAILGG
jgi:magnesium chelatase subunit I